MGSKTEEITSLQGIMNKLIEMPNKETCDKLLRKKVTAEHNSW